MKDTFTFHARRTHEDAYRVELSKPFSVHLRAVARRRYRQEVFDAVDEAEDGSHEKLATLMGFTARQYLSLDDLMTAANVAAMHVNNAGYHYWYPLTQLWAARKELACVRS